LLFVTEKKKKKKKKKKKRRRRSYDLKTYIGLDRPLGLRV
jgi:hypothetical protein